MALNYLFNPENDLALAHGGRYYTAPPLARRLHDDGAALPVWYGDSGDGFVWKNPDYRWLEKVSELYGLNVSPTIADGYASPWGWSQDACRQLSESGIEVLLNDEHIERLRQLSHRRTTIAVMTRLRERLTFDMPDVPYEARCAEDVLKYAERHSGCYIKAPWSSSGRGVMCAASLSESELRRRVEGTIRRQGSVLCEVGLTKIADFAMLFCSDGIKVSRIGLSCFFNERGAAYAGNMIAHQSQLTRIIGADEERLDEIAVALENVLTELVCPDYIGCFGVDMMLYAGAEGVAIAPCIELNLRMTMGIVAMKWGERFLTDGSRAVMRAAYGMEYRDDNAVVDGGKLIRGVQNLVPKSHGGFSITVEVAEGF